MKNILFFALFLFLYRFGLQSSAVVLPSRATQNAKPDTYTLQTQNTKNASILKRPFGKDKMKLDIESVFLINKNERLPKLYSWSVYKPHTEALFHYPISKASAFKAQLSLLPKDKGWSYHLDRLLIYSALPVDFPLHIQFGYFEYPISYSDKNRLEFKKTLLMDKILFPSTKQAAGAFLEGKLWRPFSWRISLQGHTKQGEKFFVRNPGIHPALTAGLIYKSKQNKAFLSYFQQKLSLKQSAENFGLGADFSYSFPSLKTRFKGEIWRTQRNPPDQKIISFYVFPALIWEPFSIGALIGGARHDLLNSRSSNWEYILQGSFYFTENIFFTVERIKEWDPLVRENSWLFYLTTQFDLS